LYPGDDDKLESQYNANNTDKKKYPMFTLNAAMQYLRRFRANGSVTYRVLTQYGQYNYGTSDQVVRLIDASGGSTLVIGPNQTNA
jgi:hypothetical protein